MTSGVLIDDIKNGIRINKEDLKDEKLIESIINLDTSTFHLVLNTIEKSNGSVSYHMMQKRKEENNALIESYSINTGLFSRDEEFLSLCLEYQNESKQEKQGQDFSKKKDKIDQILKEILREKGKESAKKIYQSVWNTIDSKEKIAKEEQLKEILKEYNVNIIRNTLISTIYQEVPENFLINLKNIIHFQLNNKSNKNMIDLEILKMYQCILNSLTKNNSEELINLYKTMANSSIDYKGIFYDHCKATRIACAEMLINSVYRVNPEDNNYTEINGVRVYEIEKEKFFMIVHGTSFANINFQDSNMDGISMSFISNDRLNVYSDSIIYGFEMLNPTQFLEIYSIDAGTASYHIGNDQFSVMNAAPTYSASPEEFIESTPKTQYNELLYLSGTKNTRERYEQIKALKPSYIVCINEINDQSLATGQTLEIPIIKIKAKEYTKNSRGMFAFYENQHTYRGL